MNNKGQWILLSGIILAVGLIMLVTMLNQTVLAGNRIAAAEIDFPNREILEILEETRRTAHRVHSETYHSKQDFNNNMTHFADNLSRLYATRGILIDVNVTRHTTHPNIANITMNFYDGNVRFTYGTPANPIHLTLL